MRKTLVTRLLMLALVFMLTLPMPALADGCALCGEETYSETYLCANCLLALLEEKDISGGLEISGAALNADGSVTLAWTDAADNGPYGVYYELLQAAPVPFGWTAATGVTGHEVTMTKLVPGMSYLFSVWMPRATRQSISTMPPCRRRPNASVQPSASIPESAGMKKNCGCPSMPAKSWRTTASSMVCT